MTESANHASGPSVGKLFERFFRRAPKQSRSRAVVAAVITAFEEQLQREGSDDAASLAALLDRAGVGMGSFYEYFASRESLVGVLIGHVTERNFRGLLEVVDREHAADLDAFIERCALAAARAYLEKPRVVRAVVLGIARLDLHAMIVAERDRFCEELASRAARFFPDVPRPELTRTLRTVADASMGILVAELERTTKPDVEASARTVSRLTRLLLDDMVARSSSPPAP